MCIESFNDFDGYRIHINGKLHAHWRKKHYRGLSSYICGDAKWVIEIELEGACLKLEYDKPSTWVRVLEVIGEIL